MSDWIQRIKEAKELLELGAISASEFEEIKNTLLQSNLQGIKPKTQTVPEVVSPPFEFSFEINSFKHLKKKAKGISFKRKAVPNRGKALVKIVPLSEFDALTVFYWSANHKHMVQVDAVEDSSIESPIFEKLSLSQEKTGRYEVLFGVQVRLQSGKVVCFKNKFDVEILIPQPGLTDYGGDVFVDGQPASGSIVVGDEQAEGFNNERWLKTEFVNVSKVEFEEWVHSKTASAVHTPSFDFLQDVPGKSGSPTELVDVLYGNPCTNFEIVNVANGHAKTVRVLMQPRAVFGRAFGRGTESLDVKLMLEPIRDWSLNQFRQFSDENANLSLKISGKHFEIVFNDEGVALCDLGSSNGTEVNNKRLQHEKPYPITDPTNVTVGEVLELQLTPLQNLEESIDSVWIDRLNNSPDTSYAIVRGTVGIWPDTINVLGNGYRSGIRASMIFTLREDGTPILQNISSEKCIVNTHVLNLGEAIVLRGSDIEIEYDTDRCIVLKGFEA